MPDTPSTDPPLLHIYSQSAWHDEVWMVGNRAGLLALQGAIATALKDGRGQGSGCVADGEGYEIRVMRNDEPWEEARFWILLARPYTADYAEEHRPESKWPWEIR